MYSLERAGRYIYSEQDGILVGEKPKRYNDIVSFYEEKIKENKISLMGY